MAKKSSILNCDQVLSLAKDHVTTTSADGAIAARGALLIRVAKPGTVETTLSSGQTVRSEIRSIPAVIELTIARWKLTAEDWQPANPYGITFGLLE